MSIARTSDQWWKNAVIYCLDVETFLDWNDDGIGDIDGLAERVDYLAGIGVSCLWLMPFYPSPNRDDGYDISDYYGVDHRLGTLGGFVALDPNREGPRPQGDHRPRREPHVGPTPVVPEGACIQDVALPGLLCLGRRAAETEEVGRRVPGRRRQHLGVG